MSHRITSRIVTGTIVGLLVAIPTTAWAVHAFDDVADHRYYSDAVSWADDHGITTGTSPTTFDPERDITRAEAITLDYRAWANLIRPAIENLGDVVLSIGSGSFDGDPDVIDGCRGAFGDLIAGVQIPQGATVDGFGALVMNLEPADSLEIHLERVTASGAELIGTISVSATVARQQVSVSLPVAEQVDDGEHLNVVFRPAAGSATQQICGAQISYSVT